MGADAKHDPPYPWFKVIALTSVMVGGVGVLTYHGCAGQMELREDGHAYFRALREGRIDDAYALLASQTRQEISRDAFEQALYTPQLREAPDVSFYDVEFGSAGHGCLKGGVDDGGDAFWVYLRREGDTWRVHSITFESVLTDPVWVHCRD